MGRFLALKKDLQLATDKMLKEDVPAALAAFAKQSLREEISAGRASDVYDIWVNGRYGDAEETVVPPGPILYQFQYWSEIIQFGLDALRKRSPVRSGAYRDGWFAMVDRVPVFTYDDIPVDAEVWLTNYRPYSRKIEVGHMHMSFPAGVAEDTRGTISGRYGNLITVKATMKTLPNPYVLKGIFTRGVRPQARTKLRRDTKAGALMTYPCLQLNMR